MPQFLDVREQALAAVFAEDLSEQLTEKADVAPQQLRHLEPGTFPGDRHRLA